MAESFTTAAGLGQTTPVERVRPSLREAIDRERPGKRPRKPGAPAPLPVEGPEAEEPESAEELKRSGRLVDIVI